MRLFISVELPEEIKKNIEASISGLKKSSSGVKWVEAHNLHITLKFLGSVEDEKKVISITERSLKEAKSFRVKFSGVGAFPSEKRPRVLWIGVQEGAIGLKKIADDLEDALLNAGFMKEERGFSAHLTIGRVKSEKGVDLEKMGNLADKVFGEMEVDHINIMKSTTLDTGPVYEVIKNIPLGKRGK